MKITTKTINYAVDTIEQLLLTDGADNDTIIVTDENRGGVFVFRDENSQVNNGGTIFNGWTRQYDGAVNVKWFGAKGDGITDDTLSIQNAINFVETIGGEVFFPSNIYGVTYTIIINANNLILRGAGNSTAIKYIGASRIDYLVYGTASATENVIIQDMRLLGGDYQAGKVKWVLFLEHFHRECVLRNLVIRDGLGLLNLQSCFYGRIDNIECTQTVPNPQAQGWSLAEWLEVYGSGTAPVYFGGNGGATQIDKITISKVGSELHTATTGVNTILFNKASCNINTMSFEACGTTYDSFATVTTNSIQLYGSHILLNSFYTEGCGANTRLMYVAGKSTCVMNTPFIYKFTGGTGSRIFDNDSTHGITINDGELYRLNVDMLARMSSSIAGGGAGVYLNNCVVSTGERYTDASVNAYSENTYDTRGTIALHGTSDGNLPVLNPRDSVFPQKNIGLTVTAGTDAYGSFVQVTGGILVNDRGVLLSNRIPTQTSATTMVVYKLRPQTVSYNYRLHVGIGGNLYLEASATLFTTGRGNWIASFSTDASGAITNLVDNPRLALKGTYINGFANFISASIPSNGYWSVGDTVYYSSPTAGGFIGAVCITAGTPGIWKTFGSITA